MNDRLQFEIANLTMELKGKQDLLDSSALTKSTKNIRIPTYSLTQVEKEQLRSEIKVLQAKLVILGANRYGRT